MTKAPLVSIIIPTYNEEKHIWQCLNSIASQDYPLNKIEILIVDDDSTDRTLDIARKYQKKLNIRILRNGAHQAEIGKKIGLMKCRGEFFMYFDADMAFADKNWIKISVSPLLKDKRVIGTLASFGVNKNHNALTRCISYDIFQRDPIFIFLTQDIKKTIIEKKENYYLCRFALDKIPSQSLCLYRTKILQKIFSKEKHLMDNDVPVKLIKKGYDLFAFTPQVRIYHYLIGKLKELWLKRMRGVNQTYLANFEKREYKWIDMGKKKNIIKLALFIAYANLILPASVYGLYKTLKHEDIACLYEPLITLVSTDALIYGFLTNKKGLQSLIALTNK